MPSSIFFFFYAKKFRMILRNWLAGGQSHWVMVMTATTARARQVLGVVVVDKFLDMCQLVMEVLKVLLIFLVLATGDGRSVLLNDLSLQALQP